MSTGGQAALPVREQAANQPERIATMSRGACAQLALLWTLVTLGCAKPDVIRDPLRAPILPEVVDINMPAEGIFHNLVLVSIKKEYPGHARKVMYGLWGLGLMSLAKTIVVVDHFVDVQNPSEVVWRVANTFNPSRDLVVVEGPLDDLDVASASAKFGGKLGIDGTQKMAQEGYQGQWPPDILMTPEIKKLVDSKWSEYQIKTRS